MSEPVAAANAAQIDYWNATAGQTWAQFQDQLDAQIQPLGQAALWALTPRVGDRVLDIGCGCGQTTLELAAMVGPTGRVVGIDVSRPMLDVARARPVPDGAAAPEFRETDAQTADLGAGGFDGVFSRFGVMFFADPPAAFRNIRHALTTGARLAFVCWRPLAENPWMRLPMEAAAPFLPPRPPIDPLAPGPFAFADPDRVRAMLAAAGFGEIAIDPFDADIGSGDVDRTLSLSFRVGPLGSALREHPDSAPAVAAAVRDVLVRHVAADGIVRLKGAVWIVQARAI